MVSPAAMAQPSGSGGLGDWEDVGPTDWESLSPATAYSVTPSVPATQHSPFTVPSAPLAVPLLGKRKHEPGASLESSPEGALNLVPLLRLLSDVPADTDTQAYRSLILTSVADQITRAARIYVPADEECWRLAEQTRLQFETLLSRPVSPGTRSVGSQVALTHFKDQWNTLLGSRHLPRTPLVLQKVVPVASKVAQASSHVLPITLGPQHPEGHLLLARTPGLAGGDSNGLAESIAKPLLSLVSVPGGLRLAIGPRSLDQGGIRRSSGRLEAADQQWETVFKQAAAQRWDLSRAVTQYNALAQAPLRLHWTPALPDSIQRAPLQWGQGSRRDLMMWFEYSQLARPGCLDEFIQDSATRELLEQCRRLAQEDVQALHQTPTTAPLPSMTHRQDVVTGCAVQLRLEASQQQTPEQARKIRFATPVRDIMDQLPLTERRLIDQLFTRLSMERQSGTEARSAFTQPPTSQRTYVHESTGYPIVCLLLSVPAAEEEAPADTAANAVPASAAGAGTIEPLQQGDDAFHRGVLSIVLDVATRGKWSGPSSILPPQLLQGCPGWPLGRPLEIVEAQDHAALSHAGRRSSGIEPVRIVRTPGTEVYAGLRDGQRVEVEPDGDSFYAAVLAALSDADRQTLLRAAGCEAHHMASIPHAVTALREHFANYLLNHREEHHAFIARVCHAP